MALNLVLNGQPREFAELSSTATVAEVVAALALKADRVAVELNGEIAERRRWQETAVTSGDRLEVVHFVGGGSRDRGALVLPAVPAGQA